jgi:bacterial/archaeal transporter family protein
MIGFFLGLASSILFGASGIFIKKPVRDLGVFSAIITNYFFSTLIVLVSLFLFGKFSLPSLEIIPIILFEIAVGTLAILSFFKAVKQGELSIVGPITKLNVLITIVLSVLLFGEILSFFQAVGAFILLAGSIVIALQGKKIKNLEKGALHSFFTAFGWGLFFVFLKPIVSDVGPFNTALYTEGGIFFSLLLLSLLLRKNFSINASAGKSIFVHALFTGTAAILYNFSISFIGAAKTAALLSASPAVLVILSRLVLKEKVPFYKYVAIAGIVIGLLLLALC